jgi:hypothetical protein
MRKTKQPIDASQLLSSTGGTLAQIATKTNFLKQLALIVKQICPDLPDQVWHIANIKQQICVIEVTSAIWSQRLQFERMRISQQLAELTDGQLTHIELKVAPYRNIKTLNGDQNKAPVKTQFISSHTAHQLQEVAEHAPEGLKRSLERLAKLAKK